MALDMRNAFARLCAPLGVDLTIRIGMDSAPVIAGGHRPSQVHL